MVTLAHARTNETKRFSGWSHCLPTSDATIFVFAAETQRKNGSVQNSARHVAKFAALQAWRHKPSITVSLSTPACSVHCNAAGSTTLLSNTTLLWVQQVLQHCFNHTLSAMMLLSHRADLFYIGVEGAFPFFATVKHLTCHIEKVWDRDEFVCILILMQLK